MCGGFGASGNESDPARDVDRRNADAVGGVRGEGAQRGTHIPQTRGEEAHIVGGGGGEATGQGGHTKTQTSTDTKNTSE